MHKIPFENRVGAAKPYRSYAVMGPGKKVVCELQCSPTTVNRIVGECETTIYPIDKEVKDAAA